MERGARPPAVAGAFYPRDGAALARSIEECFQDARRGPGRLPTHVRSAGRRIRAAVVPHAGYVYSGAIAAQAYAAIAAERPPASVLILGVNHHGIGAPAALSARPWATPLGPVEVDDELLGRLNRGPLEIDEEAHGPEHSIEVQLPFLEYVVPQPKFVALSITFGPLGFLREVAEVVRRAVHAHDVLLLASTDFSHYVAPEEADRLDHLALGAILARDAERLYRTVDEERISMCGIAPTTVMLAALADEPLGARLLRWGHSGETERMPAVVGYASVLFERDSPA